METKTAYEVREVTWPGKTFVIKRTKLGIDQLPAYFKESFATLYTAIQRSGMTASEPPCAIYYSVDEVKKETDLAAAVPVSGSVTAIEGLQRLTIPKSKALMVSYYGSYENMEAAYGELGKYASEHQLHKEWALEEYFSGPAAEQDPAKWKNNIYFIIS